MALLPLLTQAVKNIIILYISGLYILCSFGIYLCSKERILVNCDKVKKQIFAKY